MVVINGSMSRWRSVTSDVLHGFLQEQVLFDVLIDDMTVGSQVCPQVWFHSQHQAEWCSYTSEMQTSWSPARSSAPGLDQSQTWPQSELKTDLQKDLGVLVDFSGWQALHELPVCTCSLEGQLVCIKSGVTRRVWKKIVSLCSIFTRPQKHCIQFWGPHDKRDRNLLEQFQRKMTKVMRGLE